jgi:hypothetical protein
MTGRGICMSGGANYGVVGTTPLADGKWYTAVLKYDQSRLKLYLNGHIEGSVQNTNGVRYDSEAPTTFGTAMDSQFVADGFFNGGIGYVGFWKHAFSTAEVQTSSTTQQPVAEFAFNEGGGTRLTGVGDNMLQARLHGAARWCGASARHGPHPSLAPPAPRPTHTPPELVSTTPTHSPDPNSHPQLASPARIRSAHSLRRLSADRAAPQVHAH